MPMGMLKAVRAHAQRDGLPVTAIMLRVLELAGYGRYEPVRGSSCKRRNTAQAKSRLNKHLSAIFGKQDFVDCA